MITSNYYSHKIEELKNLNYIDRDIVPSSEPVFNVFLNTRKIEVPSYFRQLAMKGDHKAETVWFTLDRYFDGQDLADISKKWAVQFINAKNEELLVPITYRYLGMQSLGPDNKPVAPDATLKDETTLKLGWEITHDITKEAGKVQFSLRCFTIQNNDIIFNLGTEMVTATIGNTLMVSDEENPNLMNPPKDNLTELVDKIGELYKNNSLSKFNYNDLNEETLPSIDGVLLKGRVDSSNFTNVDYEKLQNKPVYRINGEELINGGDLELLAEADSVLSETSTNPIQNQAVAAKFKDIEARLEDIVTVPLNIQFFDNDLKLYEINSTYSGDITFSWEFSGKAKKLTLYNNQGTVLRDNLPIDTANGSIKIPVELNNSMQYKLLATGLGDNKSEKFTNVIFTYRLFYGAANEPEEYSENFITTLEQSSLQETKVTTFTVTPENKYVYFALPKEYGKPIFNVGGFDGGFGGNPIATVTYNETEYDIWKTDYPQKETIEINVR